MGKSNCYEISTLNNIAHYGDSDINCISHKQYNYHIEAETKLPPFYRQCRFAPTCIALAQTYNDTKQLQLTIYFYKNITQSVG